MRCKFGLFGDPHFGFPRYEGDTNFQSTRILKKVIAELNAEPELEFIVQLGDLVNENPELPSREQDLVTLQLAMKLLSELRPKTYHIVGNHDLATLSPGDLKSAFGYDQLYYTFQSRDFTNIVLYTESPGYKNIHLVDGELEWLELELRKSEKPVLIFLHQQLLEHSLTDSIYFADNPQGAFVQNAAEIRSILRSSGKVRAVINGHMHANNYLAEDGIPYFTLQSLIEDWKRIGLPAESYAVVTIAENAATFEIRGNDSITYRHSY